MALIQYPSWPAGLPYASERQPWTTPRLANPLQESEMIAGNTRALRVSTAEYEEQRIAVFFSEMQQVRLEQFFRYDLNQGASEFYMPVWQNGSYVERLVRFSGQGFSKGQQVFIDGLPGYYVTLTILIKVPFQPNA